MFLAATKPTDEVYLTAAKKHLVDAVQTHAAMVASVHGDGTVEHIPAVEPFPSIAKWCSFVSDVTGKTGARSQVFHVSQEHVWDLWEPFQKELGSAWTQILPQHGTFDPVFDQGVHHLCAARAICL